MHLQKCWQASFVRMIVECQHTKKETKQGRIQLVSIFLYYSFVQVHSSLTFYLLPGVIT